MTNRRDDLDDLKSAMQAATPAPDAARRAENLALAQKNFDALQGSRAPARPTPATGRNGLWYGVRTMFNTLTTRGGLTATTALVACGLLFATPQGRDLWQNTGIGAPETTELDGELARPQPDIVAEEATPEPITTAETAQIEAPAEAQTETPARSVQTRAAPSSPAPTGGAPSVMAGEADSLMLAPPTPPGDGFVATPEPNTETFATAEQNPLKVTVEEPVSTFSIDVDTASYGIVRNSLNRGVLPPPDAVRVEEMINYFPYDYPAPEAGKDPFAATLAVMETPWNADTQLVRIALQGTLPTLEDRPPLNLVFLIDTSGSMNDPTKLPLLKQSFGLMLDQLGPEDQVAIVEYAGSAGVALPPTTASDAATIRQALNSLGAGGSTNGQGGLEQAYALAEDMTDDGDVSRVLLATDGDFNVGLSDPSALEDFIADKRDSGTYLSVLGFGRGNLQDATMQALAQNGNGTAAYIDTLNEAQKVLVDQLSGALFPIADDVKIQVEWNPAAVAEYRLIGYETRSLRREDFNNDAVDAGELGAGHSVTALYEITPVGSPARMTDPLRYAAEDTATGDPDELGFLRLRYKAPGAEDSQLIETPIRAGGTPDDDARFAAAISGFGQLLRGSDYLGDWSYDDAIALANDARGTDPFGYRTEAVQLMRLAGSLSAD